MKTGSVGLRWDLRFWISNKLLDVTTFLILVGEIEGVTRIQVYEDYMGISRNCSLALNETGSKKLDIQANIGNSSAQSIWLNQMEHTGHLGQVKWHQYCIGKKWSESSSETKCT